MQRTMLAQRTETTEAAAQFVGRRVFGDLRSIHEKFGMSTLAELTNLAHDLEVGLAHDCLSELRLILFPRGAYRPSRIYVYKRVAIGSFAPSDHSGRIERSKELVGGNLGYEVFVRDMGTWEYLKQTGQLWISWQPCGGESTSGMAAKADGGYASGELGLARTMYTR